MKQLVNGRAMILEVVEGMAFDIGIQKMSLIFSLVIHRGVT
jgi:hypothetical protein